jgi:hypothetical protein
MSDGKEYLEKYCSSSEIDYAAERIAQRALFDLLILLVRLNVVKVRRRVESVGFVRKYRKAISD